MKLTLQWVRKAEKGMSPRNFERKSYFENESVENSFEFEIEITHKLASLKKKVKIFEVGISYYARDYSEGKKIGAKDALRAIYCILKFGIFKR